LKQIDAYEEETEEGGKASWTARKRNMMDGPIPGVFFPPGL
jgi:hypothetical protein